MTGAVDVLVDGRWPLRLPPHRAEFYATHPDWELPRLASMADRLEPGQTIIDVGAEEGDMPGLWASWGCRVALVEPKAETWSNIRAVWEGNRFLPPAGIFVGFASDVTDLDPPNPYPPASGYRLGPDGWPECAYGPVIADHGFAVLAQQHDSIPQVTLDDFATRASLTVDAITVDVEGAEARVMAGAERILAEDRPLVWLSIHHDLDWVRDLYESADLDYILKWMFARGYDAEWLGSDHESHWLFTPR